MLYLTVLSVTKPRIYIQIIYRPILFTFQNCQGMTLILMNKLVNPTKAVFVDGAYC